MRTGLFLGALLATALIGGTALADQNSGESNDRTPNRVQDIKDRVLHQQREGFKASKVDSARTGSKEASKVERIRPRGEIYGDQGTRGGKSAASRGKNLSASNSVNNPSEVAAMKKLINPMLGAYRISQASEGTDSYGGNINSKMKVGSGSSAKNLSATGSANNPSEIKAMLKMINPMQGAYRTSQAAEGTDSYGGGDKNSPFNQSKATTSVHFKNDKGEVLGSGTGENKAASRNSAMREKLSKAIGERMSKKSTSAAQDTAPKEPNSRMGK